MRPARAELTRNNRLTAFKGEGASRRHVGVRQTENRGGKITAKRTWRQDHIEPIPINFFIFMKT